MMGNEITSDGRRLTELFAQLRIAATHGAKDSDTLGQQLLEATDALKKGPQDPQRVKVRASLLAATEALDRQDRRTLIRLLREATSESHGGWLPASAPVRRATSAVTPDRGQTITTIGSTIVGRSTKIASVAALGDLVRERRRLMKLNQQAFADLAGVGRRFISELEQGKPSLEIGKVIAACAAAGIDLVGQTR